MYKRQCRELMQERAVYNSIVRGEKDGGYKIVSN